MITIVRGEIIGGARLAGRLGDAEGAHAVERCLKRVGRVVDGFRGRLIRAADGQISAAFPSPDEACLAAMEMQRRVADLPPVSGIKLTIRLGIHGGTDESEASLIAAQLLELSLPDQILCSRDTLVGLGNLLAGRVRDMHQLELSGGEAFHVVELLWHEDEDPATLTSTSILALGLGDLADASGVGPQGDGVGVVLPFPAESLVPRLCIRYRGRAYLLDEKTPFLTLGREHGNDMVIDDGKASRQHARIERRDGRYVLVDVSTNGTFITLAGEPEIFLRRENLPLRGRGILCFGVSCTDSQADRAEFEHM